MVFARVRAAGFAHDQDGLKLNLECLVMIRDIACRYRRFLLVGRSASLTLRGGVEERE